MSDYIDKIFNRAELQVIRGMLIDGIADEDDIDKRLYKQRIDEGSAPMTRFMESEYPDEEKRDEIFACIYQAITSYQDVYFEIGLKCGARLLYQLLLE